jgi:hypothetical protein
VTVTATKQKVSDLEVAEELEARAAQLPARAASAAA